MPLSRRSATMPRSVSVKAGASDMDWRPFGEVSHR
jgi:hypothetical protein